MNSCAFLPNHHNHNNNNTSDEDDMSRGQQPKKHWAKAYRTEIAASISSVVSHVATYPLENLKTKQQTDRQKGPSKLTIGDCVRDTYNKEGGMKGFMRGFVPPLFSYTFVRTSSFSVYQVTKYRCSQAIGGLTGGEEPLVTVNRPGSIPTFGTVACFGIAGAAAGAVSAVLANPFELMKNAQVLANKMAKGELKSYDIEVCRSYLDKGTINTAKTIYANMGLRTGMFSGFRFQLTRDTIGTSIFFVTYESLKQLIVRYSGSSSPTSPEAVALAGGICGVVSLTSTYPIESAKTYYQVYRLAHIRTRPVAVPAVAYFNKKSWSGYPIAAARSSIGAGIFFSCFELIKHEINALPDPRFEGHAII